MFLSEKFAVTHLFLPEKPVNTKLSVCVTYGMTTV